MPITYQHEVTPCIPDSGASGKAEPANRETDEALFASAFELAFDVLSRDELSVSSSPQEFAKTTQTCVTCVEDVLNQVTPVTSVETLAHDLTKARTASIRGVTRRNDCAT